MKTAILSAFLAILPLGAQTTQQLLPGADGNAVAQAAEAGEALVNPGTATAGDTDPLKMAAPPAVVGAKPVVQNAGDKSYVIGPEDQLAIVVWGNAQLSGTFIVAPDGRISLGLINEIMVAGLNREQLQSMIVQKLKDGGFLKDPTVTVNIIGFNSKKYFIQGEVFHPGSSPLVVPTTVLQALVSAGGFKDFANKSKIRVLRGTKSFNFNYNQVISGKHLEQNILLEPGDIIIVK